MSYLITKEDFDLWLVPNLLTLSLKGEEEWGVPCGVKAPLTFFPTLQMQTGENRRVVGVGQGSSERQHGKPDMKCSESAGKRPYKRHLLRMEGQRQCFLSGPGNTKIGTFPLAFTNLLNSLSDIPLAH